MSAAEEPDGTAHGPDGLDERHFHPVPRGGWGIPSSDEDGGPDFGRMIEALRLVQERITVASPPPEVVAEAADTLEKLAATLAPFEVDEARQIAAHRIDLPGRGQAMTPVIHIEEWDEQHVTAHVTLGRFYLGAGGAAHGGVLGLIFDEAMGRLANTGRTRSRTAYLHVNFRHITPIGPELRITAQVSRIEGRKRFLTGEIHDGDRLTADAEGLFVELLPGQP
ncbi:MAG: PaaI family thioesterase [Actinobacteria bacterium]|nr:PaaI family thioesterase [Actinomycetota bacterium]